MIQRYAAISPSMGERKIMNHSVVNRKTLVEPIASASGAEYSHSFGGARKFNSAQASLSEKWI